MKEIQLTGILPNESGRPVTPVLLDPLNTAIQSLDQGGGGTLVDLRDLSRSHQGMIHVSHRLCAPTHQIFICSQACEQGKAQEEGEGQNAQQQAATWVLFASDQDFGLTLLQPGTGHSAHSGRSSDQILQGIPRGREGIRQGIPQEIR